MDGANADPSDALGCVRGNSCRGNIHSVTAWSCLEACRSIGIQSYMVKSGKIGKTEVMYISLQAFISEETFAFSTRAEEC